MADVTGQGATCEVLLGGRVGRRRARRFCGGAKSEWPRAAPAPRDASRISSPARWEMPVVESERNAPPSASPDPQDESRFTPPTQQTSSCMGTLHRLPARPRRPRRRGGPPAPPSPSGCPACGGQVPAEAPPGAVYCSPPCRVAAVRERHDVEVRCRLANVVQAVEMLAAEVEGLIDVLAQAPVEPTTKGRRR